MNEQIALPVINADWEAPSNVHAFVTTCSGGVSEQEYASLNMALHVGDKAEHVQENRLRIASQYANATQWQWLEQVHGNLVHRVTEAGEVLRGDALVTDETGLACCVMTADCLPIFLASRQGDEVAVAHGGWRGLAADILTNSVNAMEAVGSDLLAWLGPAIGPCHFEVGADVLDKFVQGNDGEMRAQFVEQGNGKYLANLYGIARLQLTRLGVSTITGGSYCTYRDSSLFYSYRREGQCGRMLNAIYIS